MDANQFKMFLEHQTNLMHQMMRELHGSVVGATQNRQIQQPSSSTVQVPQPSPLALEGDMEENFDFFENSWKDYCKAIGMDRWPPEEDPQKVSFLLTVIGETARKKYFNFDLTAAEKANPQAALAAIKAKVVTKRNVIVDRLDFFSAVQTSRETIDDFVTRLKVVAKSAKLGNLESELIAYKVVTSNKWQHLRTKMLTIPDITLSKAVDLCRAEEITAKRTQELGVSVTGTEVHKVFKKKTSAKTQRCKFCGDNHEFVKGVCPAYGKKCYRCKGKNHFEKVCRMDEKNKGRKSKRRVKEVKQGSSTEEESSSEAEYSASESDELEIGRIFDNSHHGGNVMAELNLKFSAKWQPVMCDIDTGANTSLIGYHHLIKLSGDTNPPLLPSSFRLQSFGGNPIKVLGQVKVPCRRSGQKYRLILQVVDVDHRPLLSAKASRELGLVKFCEAVCFEGARVLPNGQSSTEEQLNIYRVQAQNIVAGYPNLFNGYGKFPGTVALEIDSSVPSSVQPPRRIPIAMRGKLKEELEALERDGIIVKEPHNTSWVSNLVIVQRAGVGSGIRICLDPVHLNKALKRPHLQFTTLDEILPELGKAKVFSTVDTKKGFWHVVLDKPSSKLTTFWTPFGRYRWTRLPFGIASAPEIFQLKLQQIIQGLKGVENLADDVLIFGVGETLEEALIDHNVCLRELCQRLDENNIKLNRSKMKLCQTSVSFYGHVLTDQGLRPDEMKILAIKNYATPCNRKEVHRFVGMVNYLSRYIPNLSINLTNLRKLISETVTWQWTAAEENEFQTVKSLVSDIGTLKYYDVTKPLVMECDASCFGLGVAIFQENGVIGYASRTLTATEKNYAQIEKELLAIVFGCIRFDQLVVGNPQVTVKTDHKPLINIFNKPLLSAPRRLQHMLLSLQRYNLAIEFVTGKENVVADALSRAPMQNYDPVVKFEKLNIYGVFDEVSDFKITNWLSITDARLTEIMQTTKQDSTMQILIHYIQQGWPQTVDRVPDNVKIFFKYRNELSTQDGMVFRNERLVIPHVLRRKLIDCCHISHNGVEATLKLARANLFWPGMSAQIKNVVNECSICAKFASSQSHPPMQSHKIPVYPFQMVSMDVFFSDYQGLKRKFLITVDHYSDFFEVNLLKDLTPESVIAACKVNFSRHGIPQLLVTDNGTNFVNQKMIQFAEEWNFEHTTSSPYHQQANGKSEAAVKIAKRLMKKSEENDGDFWYALLHWRNIPNKIGSSPVSRLFSRSTRCGVPTSAVNLQPKVVENVPTAIERNRKKMKFHYDKKTRPLPELQTGSPVYVQVHPDTSKQWSPGTVSSQLNERSYLVNVDGSEYRRNAIHLKPRKEPETKPTYRLQSAINEREQTEQTKNRQSECRMSPHCEEDENPADETSTRKNETTVSTSVIPETVQTALMRMSPSNLESSRPKRDRKLPEKFKDFVLSK
ncbi:uncharacterized protein LOC134221827 [Armigeres subalbatus]|uniref:uncharacterized protein LOC134221827 n=1 Tax=Armigeres subalbatus TaxID=124917 RepID=UPI002ED28D80